MFINILLSFVFCGLVCLIAQIIVDNSKLTPGHVTSLFVTIGVILEFFDLYKYYLSKGNNSFYGDMCFLFIFSGSLCSLIDKIFYGGSLDFIGISNLFIADIKDIYINLGILFFIISIVISGYLTEDDNTSFKEDLASIKRFLIFSKNDIVSLFKK